MSSLDCVGTTSDCEFDVRPSSLDDPARLQALRRTGLLDSAAEPAFDRLTRLATRIFQVPVALVSLVDDERQFFKSSVGLPSPWAEQRQTPLSHSFCKHVVINSQPLMVSDATTHPVLSQNPAIRELGVIAYLGVPLITSEGYALGSFCVIDGRPRNWAYDDLQMLWDLAASVMSEISLRLEIAERRRTRSDLFRFASLVESSGDFIAMADLEGRVTYVNPAGRALVGLDADAVSHTRIADFLTQDSQRVAICEAIPRAIETGQWVGKGRLRHFVTSRAISVQVNLFLISDEATGQPVGLATIVRDLTRWEQVERQHLEDEQIFRSSFDDAPIGMALVSPSGKWLKVNRALSGLLHISALDLVNFDIRQVLHPDDVDACQEQFDRVRDGTIRSFQIETRFLNTDGELVWALLNVSLVREPAGTPLYFIAQIQDLTDRREIEQDLHRAKNAAEAASRSKSEFLANISHEVRTPMTAIVGNADILREPGLSEFERGVALQAIRRNATHLLQLINDILDLSKIEAGHMELKPVPCDPWRIVCEVVADLEATASAKGVRLESSRVGESPSCVNLDPTRFRQILVNLVGNAIKFTESEGRVTVRVAARLGLAPDPSETILVLEVLDHGIGMSPEQVTQLFRPFQQGDTSFTRKYGGTGLGLNITSRLVNAMGGTIEVASRLGAGSRFTVRLPVKRIDPTAAITGPKPGGVRSRFVRVRSGLSSPTAAEDRANSTSRTSDVASRLGRILLAEDSVENQRVLTFFLNRAGLSVELAENGRVAVEKAITGGFDLILMDMQMPELDGYGAASALRRVGYRGPIIALTAHAMKDDRARCLSAGCDDYLTKPVEIPLLLDLIDRLLPPQPPKAASP